VRRDSVRGLTTAAAVWVTAAVGAACGAGLPILACAATVIYFIVAVTFPSLTNRLPHSSTVISVIKVRYPEGQGILREVLQLATNRGFALSEISTETDRYRHPQDRSSDGSESEIAMVSVTLQVRGRALVNDLVAALSELHGVDAVLADDVNSNSE
jgi:putative Mg2+ transporter-C (MgtC) family protein